VEEAERWGDEEFQPIPRRLFRFGVARFPKLRQWAVRNQGLPAPTVMAVAMQPVVGYYARTVEADGRRATEAGVRADLVALPRMLDRVDQLFADNTLTLDPPNAATLQILATTNALDAFSDLRDLVRSHACAEPAESLFGAYPVRLPKYFEPQWLEPLATGP
jgi:glutathione S-transferase